MNTVVADAWLASIEVGIHFECRSEIRELLVRHRRLGAVATPVELTPQDYDEWVLEA